MQVFKKESRSVNKYYANKLSLYLSVLMGTFNISHTHTDTHTHTHTHIHKYIYISVCVGK